jgi:hypothetical protein
VSGVAPVTVTEVDCVVLLALLEHVSVKVVFAVRFEIVCVPLVVLVPVQPLLAVQLVAFVDDHVIVEDCPEVTDVGFAEMVTVGIFLKTPKCEALVVVKVHVPLVMVQVAAERPVVVHPVALSSERKRSSVSPLKVVGTWMVSVAGLLKLSCVPLMPHW